MMQKGNQTQTEALYCSKDAITPDGWFIIELTETDTLTFEGVSPYYSTASVEDAQRKSSGRPRRSVILSPGTYYFYLKFKAKQQTFTVTSKASFQHTEVFDATTGGPNYFGLLVHLNSLHLLSSVSRLGLRYGLRIDEERKSIDLSTFTHLTHLYLGSGRGSKYPLWKIRGLDTVGANLLTFNVGIEKLPDLSQMPHLVSIYNSYEADWSNVPKNCMHSQLQLANMRVRYEDYDKSLNFFLTNKSSLTYLNMPNYIQWKYFMQRHYDELQNLIETGLRKQGNVSMNGRRITGVNDRQILFSDGGNYSRTFPTLHIQNYPGQTFIGFKLTLTSSIRITFSEALNVQADSESFGHAQAKPKAAVTELTLEAMTETSYDLYITRNDSDVNAGRTDIDCLMGISDFSAISGLHATTEEIAGSTNQYGLCIDANDLVQLSAVRTLGLRHGVTHLHPHATVDLRSFTNLQDLYIGSADEQVGFIDYLLLTDSTMSQLRTYDVGIRILPANFTKLSNCATLYAKDVRSWENVILNADSPIQNPVQVAIGAADEFFDTALNFFYQNRDSLHGEVCMPDFTRNESFLRANVQKIIAIGQSLSSHGRVIKLGSHRITARDSKKKTITLDHQTTYIQSQQ